MLRQENFLKIEENIVERLIQQISASCIVQDIPVFCTHKDRRCFKCYVVFSSLSSSSKFSS